MCEESSPIAIRSRTYTNTCNAYLLMPMNTLSYYIYDRSIYTLKLSFSN